MKKLIIAFVILTVSIMYSQTPDFHTNVTNLWYQGYKSNVLEIAEQRLSTDTNDIVGLILKLEFEAAFLEFSSISNTAQRVLDVAPMITTTNFANLFPFYTNRVHILLDVIPRYTSEKLAIDKPKAFIPHKPTPADRFIKALQDDGYFEK